MMMQGKLHQELECIHKNVGKATYAYHQPLNCTRSINHLMCEVTWIIITAKVIFHSFTVWFSFGPWDTPNKNCEVTWLCWEPNYLLQPHSCNILELLKCTRDHNLLKKYWWRHFVQTKPFWQSNGIYHFHKNETCLQWKYF